MVQPTPSGAAIPHSEPARPAGALAKALRAHWPEYLMEAASLGLFLVAACAFSVLLEHPSSPVHQSLGNPLVRRMLMGLAMGGTAIALIFSPWGKRSGAHLNPAVTLTFLRLKKVEPADALFYVASQFAGAVFGVLIASAALRGAAGHPSVRYAATVPGQTGPVIAFAAEAAISFLLMAVILAASNRPTLSRFTGVFAGMMIATFITLEAPFSGMSMNPARTFGSAAGARVWDFLWIYFVAPPVGMLLAAELRTRRNRIVWCAKLHHDNDKRCIFRCGYRATQRPHPTLSRR
jgi:aquaporin Z